MLINRLYWTDTYGISGAWCWVDLTRDDSKTFVVILVFYSLVWFLILLNCVFVVKLIIMLNNELRTDKEKLKKYTNKLIWYPVIQIICLLPATVNRIIFLINPTNNTPTLDIIQAAFDSMTGFMFAIVYGFNPSVKESIKEVFAYICCRNKRAETPMRSLTNKRLTQNSNDDSNDHSFSDFDKSRI